MLNIKIPRNWQKDNYTISRIYLNGVLQPYNSLEDKDRGLDSSMPLEEINNKKVYGKTAIPAGRYKVTKYLSPRFKRYLPRIEKVPGYSGVLIHPGNTAEDSLGCILIGKNDVVGKVTNSRYWFKKFYAELDKYWKKGEEVWLTIG